MDKSVLYVFLAVGVAFGITWLISYLRRKELLKQEDLITAIKLLDLNLKVTSELRLDRQDDILQIAEIVMDSLEYAISFYNNETDVIKNAYEYALELCTVFGVEMNESREEIVWELINITFNNKYIDFVEE